MINMHYIDCMKFMADKPNGFYDLAIIDPPYGIGRANRNKEIIKVKNSKNSYAKRHDYGGKKWDSKSPDKNYFKELVRVSKDQIIWGANHFIENIPNANTSNWIIWDKVDTLPTYADGEMAWCSIKKPLKIVPLIHSGFRRGLNIGRGSKLKYNKPFSGSMDIHPTQKPIKLYEWLLMNYAKEGDTILDTHGGSGSIAIACHNLGFDLDWCELDTEYFEAAKKRFDIHKSQQRLF